MNNERFALGLNVSLVYLPANLGTVLVVVLDCLGACFGANVWFV